MGRGNRKSGCEDDEKGKRKTTQHSQDKQGASKGKGNKSQRVKGDKQDMVRPGHNSRKGEDTNKRAQRGKKRIRLLGQKRADGFEKNSVGGLGKRAADYT